MYMHKHIKHSHTPLSCFCFLDAFASFLDLIFGEVGLKGKEETSRLLTYLLSHWL